MEEQGFGFSKRFSRKAANIHGITPGLRALPFRAVAIISLLIVVNIVVWIAVAIILHWEPALVSTAVLSWILGLRHALDADHISAIDLMTRRLIAGGQKPVTVGTFFSLGHSTIVIITSIVVAATSAAVSERFDRFSRVGGIIGSSVSAAFLILLGVMNVWILVKLVQHLKRLINRPMGSPEEEREEHMKFEGEGVFFRIFRRLFKLIDKPWKMYPLGVLFGLGFDTSSEIALLGISSIQAARGTSIWLILIFPLLFTAGMCLLDTADGALMMSLYTSATLARDTIAILYYSITLTAVTVVVALFIGVVQALILADAIISPEDPVPPFWAGVEALGDRYDIVGGCICGLFVIVGTLSVLFYRPWRRRINKMRARIAVVEDFPSVPEVEAGARYSDAIEMVDDYPGNSGERELESYEGKRVESSVQQVGDLGRS